MSERILLEATNEAIFRQELQTAIGGVKVGRLHVVNERVTAPTITTLPVLDGQTVRIRSVVLARQVGGSAGVVGNSASWELVGTFKNVGGTLSQVGTTTYLVTHEDDSDLGTDYDITANVLSLQAEFNGATDSLNLEVVWNSYSYLHVLHES